LPKWSGSIKADLDLQAQIKLIVTRNEKGFIENKVSNIEIIEKINSLEINGAALIKWLITTEFIRNFIVKKVENVVVRQINELLGI